MLPVASTVWTPGEQGTITYRFAGTLSDGENYEIDLMTGDPENAQLVHVFDETTTPRGSGTNSVTVKVPDNIPDGTYGIRLGLPDQADWLYSQLFAIGANPRAAGNPGPGVAPAPATELDDTRPAAKPVAKPSEDGSGAGAQPGSLVPAHVALMVAAWLL
ncbi:hypothetical protein GGF46_003638 [Coemansia sp. RSA 552]|nr:hypothetical protein GGF46_003638 [Coemansia sp. RSA 552]